MGFNGTSGLFPNNRNRMKIRTNAMVYGPLGLSSGGTTEITTSAFFGYRRKMWEEFLSNSWCLLFPSWVYFGLVFGSGFSLISTSRAIAPYLSK